MVDKAIQDLLHKVISSNPRGVMIVYTTAEGDKWAMEMAGYERRDTINLTAYSIFRMNAMQRSYFAAQSQSEQVAPMMHAPQRSELAVQKGQIPRAVRRALKKQRNKQK